MPSGGFRVGAGRKPKGVKPDPNRAEIEAALQAGSYLPLDYLLSVMRDPNADPVRRDRAAAVLAPFLHGKTDMGGKKEERQRAAGEVAKGKFAPAAAPRLVVSNQ